MDKKEYTMDEIINLQDSELVYAATDIKTENAYYEMPGRAFNSPESPIGEIMTNMLAHAKKEPGDAKVAMNIINIDGEKWLMCLQTGEPLGVATFKKMMKYGHKLEENYEPEMEENHMCNVGLNDSESYFSPSGHFMYSSINRAENCVYTLINNKPSYEAYKIFKLPLSNWTFSSFGDEYTTVILIRVDKPEDRPTHDASEIDFRNIPDYLRDKYAMDQLLNQNLSIFFNGKEVKPRLHAFPFLHNQVRAFKKTVYSEEMKSKRKNIKISYFEWEGKKCIKGTIHCPIINGEIDFIQVKAPERGGEHESAGLVIFNYGVRIENVGFKYFANLDTYKKHGPNYLEFNSDKEAIKPSRHEPDRYATYINLRPGPKSGLSFSKDKTSINTLNLIGKLLRAFIDDVWGDLYREAVRTSDEKRENAAANLLLTVFHSNLCSNSRYLQEVEFDYGNRTYRMDAFLLPITKFNKEKLAKYDERCKKRKTKPRYKLTKEDFMFQEPDKTEENWGYGLHIVEFKKIVNRTMQKDDISEATDYAMMLASVFGLDFRHIPVTVCGNTPDEAMNIFARDKCALGFDVNICDMSKFNE